MGDWRNKLRREADNYRQWCQRNEEILRARVRAGERFACCCGAVVWQRGGPSGKIWHVATEGKPEAFYCAACMPSDVEDAMKEMRKAYGREGFTERQDMRQLALFALGERRR